MNIKNLEILSSNFQEQVAFYSKTLGLEVIESNLEKARFQIGKSEFTLKKSDHFTPYHFAFNIPSNKEEEALAWLKERVEILRDGSFEIQDFDSWNAKAIYFYDADKNIVEFIARKSLKIEQEGSFGPESLLEISEIGAPVTDIESAYKSITKVLPIEIFDGSFERFCAIGDEHGLFICINKNVKDWFPTNDKAHSSEFTLSFDEKGRNYKIEFSGGRLREQ